MIASWEALRLACDVVLSGLQSFELLVISNVSCSSATPSSLPELIISVSLGDAVARLGFGTPEKPTKRALVSRPPVTPRLVSGLITPLA